MMVAALGLEAIAMEEVMSMGDSDNDGMVAAGEVVEVTVVVVEVGAAVALVERRYGARKMCTEVGQPGF